MKFRRVGHHIPISLQVETRHCALQPGEIDVMEQIIHSLEPYSAHMRSCNVDVLISYSSTMDEIHVLTILDAPDLFAVTGEHDTVLLPAFENCVKKLRFRLSSCDATAKPSKITPCQGHNIQADLTQQTDTNQPRETVTSDPVRTGCSKFNASKSVLHPACITRELEELRPAILSKVNDRLAPMLRTINETDAAQVRSIFVDEVIANAVVHLEQRPRAMRLGDWVQGLVSPSIRSLLGGRASPESFGAFLALVCDSEDRSMGTEELENLCRSRPR